MPPRLLSAFALAVSAASVPLAAHADVKLPAILGDNMVLQSGVPVPVWGTAEPGEAVEVRVTVTARQENAVAATVAQVAQAQGTVADKEGTWKVTLAPLPPSDEPIGFVVTGKNKVSLENVLVGEVWVCSGQSNMEWALNNANDGPAETAKADFPKMRLFVVPKKVAMEPQADCDGRWVECSPQTAGGFSAVGYFFGKDILEATKRPVGLIGTYWGGTPAESWTSRESLEAEESLKPLLDRWADADAKVAAGQAKPEQGPNNPHHPAGLYNGMIAPILPYALRGAIWYQGESNAGRAYQYRTLFPAMITDWRQSWGGGDFTFLWVQLANFMDRKEQPGESAWAELREAQTMTLDLPNTGQAVIIDIGEAKDIHPRNKQDVGHRLALAARKLTYGEDIVYSGPTLQDAQFGDGKATLTFGDVGGGLEGKGGAVKGFTLAGSDHVFHPAEATIDGDKIILSSPQVPQPQAARYGWADNPEATLYNAEGLPASPFRTDDWPGVTVNNK